MSLRPHTSIEEKKPHSFVLSERISEVKEYYFATKLRQIEEMNRRGKDVINLGIGSPDHPPHPDVIQTLYQESLNSHQHGYQNYRGHLRLREAAANWYKKYYNVELDPGKEILPLIGSKEGIMHICMTYINKGDEVLIPDPGYPTYRSAATIAGATIRTYALKEENDWFPDLAAMESHDMSKVKLMFVNYPHMPTGAPADMEKFQQLIDFGRRNNILICHDNPYSFILNDNPISIMRAEGAREVAIELNSLSKSHNMAGWRIGFAIANADRINEIMRFKSNMDSGMFLPLQLAAAKALSLGADWYRQVNEVYRQRRELVYQLLDTLGVKYSKGRPGLFVWGSVPADFESGYELTDRILEKANVFLTPGGIFGRNGENYIRVSLCATREKIEESIKRIKAAGIAIR